jgi:hypothetical protein
MGSIKDHFPEGTSAHAVLDELISNLSEDDVWNVALFARALLGSGLYSAALAQGLVIGHDVSEQQKQEMLDRLKERSENKVSVPPAILRGMN